MWRGSIPPCAASSRRIACRCSPSRLMWTCCCTRWSRWLPTSRAHTRSYVDSSILEWRIARVDLTATVLRTYDGYAKRAVASVPGPPDVRKLYPCYSVAGAVASVASDVAAVSGAVSETGAGGVGVAGVAAVAAACGATRVAVLFGARLRSFGTLTIVRRQRVQM